MAGQADATAVQALRAFIAAVFAAEAELAAVFLGAEAAVRTVGVVFHAAVLAHIARLTEDTAVAAAFAFLADLIVANQTVVALLAVAQLFDGAVLAHMAVVAPLSGTLLAQSAAAQALGFLTVGREEAVLTLFAGSSLFQMADQADAAAVQTLRAFIAAAQAAAADLAADIFFGTSPAVRAVLCILCGAFHAHLAGFAPIRAVFTGAALSRTGQIVHIAFIAVRTVALLINGALLAHMAGITEVTAAVCASPADQALLGIIVDKALSAVRTGHAVIQMAFQAGAADDAL